MPSITYRGLDITEKENELIVRGIKNFVPRHIFECGQCFCWQKTDEDCYEGVAGGRYIKVAASYGVAPESLRRDIGRSADPQSVTFTNTSLQDFTEFWYDYFDLGTDYCHIKKSVADDRIMREAVEFGSGIRLLRQDFWEMLISFIISANNNIPRISASIRKISGRWGTRIDSTCDTDRFSFPTPKSLMQAELPELRETGVGFRDKYIKSTAYKTVHEIMGKYKDIDAFTAVLASLPAEQSEKMLMTFDGVGQKVADCVLLFSGLHTDVFPKDVWVFRVMDTLYPAIIGSTGKHTAASINTLASLRFGRLMGYAQQYLFYYARGNAIGK